MKEFYAKKRAFAQLLQFFTQLRAVQATIPDLQCYQFDFIPQSPFLVKLIIYPASASWEGLLAPALLL